MHSQGILLISQGSGPHYTLNVSIQTEALVYCASASTPPLRSPNLTAEPSETKLVCWTRYAMTWLVALYKCKHEHTTSNNMKIFFLTRPGFELEPNLVPQYYATASLDAFAHTLPL